MPGTVLILSYVWPEPSSSAAGVRTASLVEILLSRGWNVVLASGSRPNDASASFESRGVRTVQVAPNDPAFDRFVAGLRPEAAIFDRFVIEEQFGWRVRLHSPRTLRVLDTMDLHFLRRGRERALRRSDAGDPRPFAELSRLAADELVSDDTLRELASIHRSDLTLVLSSFEEALLTERLGVPPDALALLGFAYPPAAAAPAFEERSGFAFVGNFRHAPNADGARWLRERLWPRIRKKLPGAIASIHGAYPSRAIMELDDPPQGFRVPGPADDLARVFGACRVNLAPLRFGAGIKGKITDGWRHGAPAAATSIAAEGICGALPFGGIVADGEEAFADAAVRLHEDRGAWSEAARLGRSALEGCHGLEGAASRLDGALRAGLSRMEERRGANLAGAMLWHQSNRATEYFSRWIELKERGGAGAQRPEPPREDPGPSPDPSTSFTPSFSPVVGSTSPILPRATD